MSDHQNKYLENVSIEYRNHELIGNGLFPIVPVKFKSDDVAVFRKRGNKVYETRRGTDGKSNRIRWEYESATYSCVNHALHDFVSRKRIRNADAPIEPQVRCTQEVTNAILLAREARIAAVATNPANYGGNVINLAGGTYKSWNEADNDPIANLLELREMCAQDPNRLFLSRDSWYWMRQSSAVQTLVSGGGTPERPGLLKLTGLNDLFEVEEIYIGKAFYDSTPKDSAETRVNLWAGCAIFAYVNPRPGLDMFSYGFMPMWTENGGTDGYKINQWEDASIDGGAVFIEVEEDVDEFVICPTAGAIAYNCVA